MEDKRIKCIFCKEPIHIDNWAGVNKDGFFCKNITCLMELIKSQDRSSTYSAPATPSEGISEKQGSLQTSDSKGNIHQENKELLDKDYDKAEIKSDYVERSYGI